MMFARIRRAGAFASLVAAISFAAPVGGASAATPGQPTPITVNPEFAARVAGGNVGLPEASGVQEAQNRRQVRRSANRRAATRRSFQRQRVASRNRVVRNNRARPGYYPNRRSAYRRGYRQGYRNGARHYYGGRWYTYRDNYWYNDAGVAFGAAAIGLVAGAAIAGAYDNNTTTVVVDDDYGYGAPYSAGWYRACSAKYRSFRASDGTYLGYDGLRHTCRLP